MDGLNTSIYQAAGFLGYIPGRSSVRVLFQSEAGRFFVWVEDDRKAAASLTLFVIAEDEKYHGFKLYCDLITGRVTVDAADSLEVESPRLWAPQSPL